MVLTIPDHCLDWNDVVSDGDGKCEWCVVEMDTLDGVIIILLMIPFSQLLFKKLESVQQELMKVKNRRINVTVETLEEIKLQTWDIHSYNISQESNLMSVLVTMFIDKYSLLLLGMLLHIWCPLSHLLCDRGWSFKLRLHSNLILCSSNRFYLFLISTSYSSYLSCFLMWVNTWWMMNRQSTVWLSVLSLWNEFRVSFWLRRLRSLLETIESELMWLCLMVTSIGMK